MDEVFYQLSWDGLPGIFSEGVTVPASEIIHDKMNTFWHPLVGVSPIAACGLAAMQGLQIQTNSAKFHENGARPSGLLLAPEGVAQEQVDRLKETWQTQFSGQNAGRVAILSDGMTYQAVEPMKASDAQLIEQLRWTAETVCSAFHVPPYKIGVGAMPSYNNVQALNTEYYSGCLQIHIEAIELCLDDGLGLGPGYGNRYGTEFDLDDLLRMDTQTLVSTYAEAAQRGMAPNEFRKKLNLPPVEGGDVPLLQEQMWPIQKLSDPDRALPGAREEAPEPPALPEPEDEDQTERAVAAMRMKFAEALYAV